MTSDRALKPYCPADIAFVDTSTASAFDPSDLTQAVAWWKVSQLVASDNDLISSFTDAIGGETATTSGSTRPTYKANSGDPYLLFNGAHHLVTSLTTAFGDFSVIVVGELVTAVSGERLVDKNYVNGFWTGIRPGFTDYLGGGILQSSPPYGDFVALAPGVPFTFLFERDGTNKRIRLNGSQTIVSCVSTACDTSALTIGSDGASNFGSFKLKELIVCNDNLSAGDVTNLNAYTNDQYGLNF